MTGRTQDQILARFQAITEDDVFGFRREVLTEAMSLDTVRAALPGVGIPDSWAWAPLVLDVAAREYLTFAIEKIVNHRGISASRSVDKLGEYAWLLGRDDVVSEMESADYAQYGAPKVKAFADGMGWPWPGDIAGRTGSEQYAREVTAQLERMTRGGPCEPDCHMGCDS